MGRRVNSAKIYKMDTEYSFGFHSTVVIGLNLFRNFRASSVFIRTMKCRVLTRFDF